MTQAGAVNGGAVPARDPAPASLLRCRFWSLPLIVVLATIAPAFGFDDVMFFNYMNNVADPHAAFRYRDFVPLLPELVAYSLKDLPLVAQAVLYRLPPLCVMWLLSRELYSLFTPKGSRGEGLALSASMMLILWWFIPPMWTNLVYTNVSMIVLALVHMLRVGQERRTYSPASLGLLAFAVASIPFGALLIAVLLSQWRRARAPGQRRQIIAASIFLAAVYLAMNGRAIGAIVVPNPVDIVLGFRDGLRTDYRLHNVVVAVSSLVLVLAGAEAARQRRRMPDAHVTWTLVLVGLASVGSVMVSDRFPENSGGFAAHHALLVVTCAMLVVGRSILATADQYRRASWLGCVAGVAMVATATVLATGLRGPLETALMKYRFLMVAEEFRRDCREGDAMVFEHADTSPVILCRLAVLPPGHYEQSHIPPSIGLPRSTASEDEVPLIVSFEPALPTGLR